MDGRQVFSKALLQVLTDQGLCPVDSVYLKQSDTDLTQWVVLASPPLASQHVSWVPLPTDISQCHTHWALEKQSLYKIKG